MKPIVVIGSINMDLVCRTAALPRGGETVLGEDFVTIPGGKGANQAVAAAKLALPDTAVHMLGRVGDDDFGQRLLNGLRQYNVNTKRVIVTEGIASGVAMILVDRKGENSIVVAPGANAKLSPADIDAAKDLIASASVVVMQLEVPLATVRHAIAMCQRLGVFTILDPAPAPLKPLPRAFFGVDIFTPNEHEAESAIGNRAACPREIQAVSRAKTNGRRSAGARRKSRGIKIRRQGINLCRRERPIRNRQAVQSEGGRHNSGRGCLHWRAGRGARGNDATGGCVAFCQRRRRDLLSKLRSATCAPNPRSRLYRLDAAPR